MPNQFKGFCYPTLSDAANADLGSGVISSASGIVSPTSYSLINANSVDMTYLYKPLTIGSQSSYVHTRTYPLCESVGQIDNNSGITVEDALIASWLVIGVWAAAYFFKAFRSGVRGY
jgi:hypothetical protein